MTELSTIYLEECEVRSTMLGVVSTKKVEASSSTLVDSTSDCQDRPCTTASWAESPTVSLEGQEVTFTTLGVVSMTDATTLPAATVDFISDGQDRSCAAAESSCDAALTMELSTGLSRTWETILGVVSTVAIDASSLSLTTVGPGIVTSASEWSPLCEVESMSELGGNPSAGSSRWNIFSTRSADGACSSRSCPCEYKSH